MAQLHNLLLHLLGDGVEDDFDVILNYCVERHTIEVIRHSTIWIEICEPFDCLTKNCLEIVNYEMDEYFTDLSEMSARKMVEDFIGNLYLSDEF